MWVLPCPSRSNILLGTAREFLRARGLSLRNAHIGNPCVGRGFFVAPFASASPPTTAGPVDHQPSLDFAVYRASCSQPMQTGLRLTEQTTAHVQHRSACTARAQLCEGNSCLRAPTRCMPWLGAGLSQRGFSPERAHLCARALLGSRFYENRTAPKAGSLDVPILVVVGGTVF